MKKVNWLFFRLSLCLFQVRFAGCLDFFQLSSEHLEFSLWECSPWVGLLLCRPASRLAITRTIWSEWTRLSGNIQYSRYFDPITGNQHCSTSINIIQHKICTWFRLSIGFLKAYCHNSHELGYTEPISPNLVKVSQAIHTSQTSAKAVRSELLLFKSLIL
jgi:hypothetical protein